MRDIQKLFAAVEQYKAINKASIKKIAEAAHEIAIKMDEAEIDWLDLDGGVSVDRYTLQSNIGYAECIAIGRSEYIEPEYRCVRGNLDSTEKSGSWCYLHGDFNVRYATATANQRLLFAARLQEIVEKLTLKIEGKITQRKAAIDQCNLNHYKGRPGQC